MGVNNSKAVRKVTAMNVKVRHIAILKTQIRNLFFKGNPLIKRRMMPRDAIKDMVFMIMKKRY